MRVALAAGLGFFPLPGDLRPGLDLKPGDFLPGLGVKPGDFLPGLDKVLAGLLAALDLQQQETGLHL